MAQTESNISGDVPLEDGDNLSESQLRKYIARGNAVDYVEDGCGFSVDHTNDTIDIGTTTTDGNFAIIEDSQQAYPLFPDQATGIALPNASATNHVFIAYDTSNDQIYYHIDDDDTAPSDPSLKIGTVDTANDTSTELNREPSIATGQLNSEDLTAATTDHWLTVGASPPDLQTAAHTWEPESGSPYTATGASSANSINPSGLDSFDSYLVFFKATDQASSGAQVDLEIDGETGANYTQIKFSGTVSTGQSLLSRITFVNGDGSASLWFTLNEFNSNHGYSGLGGESTGSATEAGSQGNTAWPPSQFTLKRGQDTDWEVRVWGRDI